MTSTSSVGRHLSYAHIITSNIESSQVDINLGGRLLAAYDIIDMTTMKAMKYRYIRRKQRWISEDNIPDGAHYEGYDFLFLHGDDGDNEVQQDYEALPPSPQQPQQQPPQQPPPYSTYYGITPPPNISPSMAYISAQLRHMHDYITRMFTAINTYLKRQCDRICCIEGHLLPARPARDDRASSFARQTSSH
ncbi:hypothetical protein Scep_018971 [Stephania cephalantha]|uniref:Uncharacterized protein n=1 Tax=Stephania cephalantha TaxID=152367 RepID=A0AAP0IA44_9MAGN